MDWIRHGLDIDKTWKCLNQWACILASGYGKPNKDWKIEELMEERTNVANYE